MRVLIVDDELQMAEALRRGLEREGYSTLLALDTGVRGQLNLDDADGSHFTDSAEST
jgi:DNA-binding response OmpR family regulator